MNRGVRRNLLRGRENDFLQISQDSRNEDLFWGFNILRTISWDLFVAVTSTIAENDI